MGERVHVAVDSPRAAAITTPIEQIVGWVATPPPEDLRVLVESKEIPCAIIDRPDLVRSGIAGFGFSMFLDLIDLSRYRTLSAGSLELSFFSADTFIASFTADLASSALAGLVDLVADRERKQKFVRTNATIRGSREGVRAANALPDDWPISPDISKKTDATSSINYRPLVYEFANSIPGSGYILDAGAGLRRHPHPRVIAMEIYDYPSTDILAVGQKIPFDDNTFDGAISIAVLEHVDNPFICAKEIMRVVRPGGKILLDVPFLQAEHGYPSHYFNATRFGARKLFEEAYLESQSIDMVNHPVFTLHQILGLYAAGLPSTLREQFLNAPIRSFTDVAPAQLYLEKHPFVTELSEDAQWTLAWGTTSIFTVP
jgi:SAM-dependent methyltransferase